MILTIGDEENTDRAELKLDHIQYFVQNRSTKHVQKIANEQMLLEEMT